MTAEEQRIAIAEWCGWKCIENHGRGSIWGFASDSSGRRELPDYLNDLNFMHEAEGFLGDRRGAYEDWLVAICHGLRRSIYATAAQRAEALLRTIGKWKETK